jgi:hypothetical protein
MLMMYVQLLGHAPESLLRLKSQITDTCIQIRKLSYHV